jgi:hypothetical protein
MLIEQPDRVYGRRVCNKPRKARAHHGQIVLNKGNSKAVPTMDEKGKALTDAANQLGLADGRAQQVLGQLWDSAFEQGRLAALDELQDRFCVCMK